MSGVVAGANNFETVQALVDGELRQMPQVVQIPFREGHYTTLLLAGSSSAANPNRGGQGANMDATAGNIFVNLPSFAMGSGGGSNFALRWWAYGTVVGIRTRIIAGAPTYTVKVDGVSYPVTLTNAFNGDATLTVDDYWANVIVADDLPPGRHACELVITAVNSSAISLAILGWLGDSRVYPPQIRYLDRVTGTVPTSASAIAYNVGASNVLHFIRGVIYTNTNASARDVTISISGTTTVAVLHLAAAGSAGDTATFDLLGPFANAGTLYHVASGAGVNYTTLGGF